MKASKRTSVQPPVPLRRAYTGAVGSCWREDRMRSVMLESAGGIQSSSVADSVMGVWFCTP